MDSDYFGNMFGLICSSIFICLGCIATLFWVYTLFDAISRNFANNTDKAIWILILLLFPGIGSLIYLFVVIFGSKK